MKATCRYSALIFAVLLIGLSAIQLRAQGLTQLDQKIFGAPAGKIAVLKGTSVDTVFLAAGRDVKALAVNHASPGSPTPISALNYRASDQIMALHVKSPHIYIGTPMGMIIKHITALTTNTVAELTGKPISAIAANNSGDKAYVGIALPDSGYKILDVTNPAAATILGGDTLTHGRVTSLEYWSQGSGDTLYVAAEDVIGTGGAFMRAYDVTTPASTVYLTHNATGSATYYDDIAVTPDSIYVADRNSGYKVFYRFGAPPIMSANSSIPVDSGANWIDIMGDSVVAVSNKNGLYIVDAKTGQSLSGPTRINGAGPGQITSTIYNLVAKIYGAFHVQGLQILSLPTKTTTPFQNGSGYPTGDYIYDAVGNNGYAYLANGGAGLRVINSTSHSEAGGSPFYFAGSPGMHYAHLATDNDLLFAADQGNSLDIIDISNPAVPALLSSYLLSGVSTITDLEVADSILVIGTDGGAKLVDISEPASPAVVGSGISVGSGLKEIKIRNGFLYGARNSGGLDIWNIANPLSPGFMDSETGVGIGTFDTDGRTAYFASADTIFMLDVRTPASIIKGSALIEFTGPMISAIALSGHHIHAGTSGPGGGKIHVFNIADTNSVLIADSAMVGGQPLSFFIEGLYLHATVMDTGYYFYSDHYGKARVSIERRSGIPSDTISIPVMLHDNLTPVGNISLEMNVTFDTLMLNFLGAEARNALAGGLDSLLANVIHTGMQKDTLRIAWADTASISGPDTMVVMRFKVMPNAPVEPLLRTTEIDFSSVIFDEGFPAVQAYSGNVDIIPRFGDANQSGMVSAPDASRILQSVVGIPPVPPAILADVSFNGEIRAFDAALVLKRILIPGFRFPVEDKFGIYYKSGAGNTEENARILVTTGDNTIDSPDMPEELVRPLIYSISVRDINQVVSAEMVIDFGEGQEFIDYILPPEFADFNVEFRRDGSRVYISMAGSEPVSEDGMLIQLMTRISAEGSPEPIEIVELYLNESRIMGIEGARPAIPKTYSLGQNYPNPFNPITRIQYQLPGESRVTLTIYNILGQEVRRLITNTVQPAGFYTVQWDGRDEAGNAVASGVYFYRIRSGAYSKTMKMLFLK